MYVPTGRPRGRPRKIITEPVVEIPKKKRGRPPKNPNEPITKKLGKSPKKSKKELALEEGTDYFPTQSTTSSLVNHRYHFKDGTTCLVTYGNCKLKPVNIKLYKEKNVSNT